MVVSFVNAGLMTLAQSMAVIFGANVGTTFTAWIIALFGFKVDTSLFILPLIACSVPLLFSKKSRTKSIGEFLIGFSFLFMGLDMISDYVPDLQSNPEMFAFLERYASMGFTSVLLFLLVGIILTAVIQSSAATFAIVLIMCTKGWISFDLACAVVLGSNIGTTITPLLASMSGNVAAKRTAMGHLLFNALGIIWTLCVFYPFVNLNVWITEALGQGNPEALFTYVNTLEDTQPEIYNQLFAGSLPSGHEVLSQIAMMQFSVSFGLSMFHTVFNLINLSIMIWLTGVYVKIVEKLIPAKHKEDEEFQLVHSKEKSEEFSQLFSRLEKYEEISDRMEIEIANYLNRCAEGRLSNEGKLHIAAMLNIVSEIESIADCCFGCAKILIRKQESGVDFTELIYKNIDAMFGYLKEAMTDMIELLSDVEKAREVAIIRSYNKEREINNLRNQLRTNNVENINNRVYEYQSGIYYMDIINDLEKMGDYIINVVDTIRDHFRKHVA